MISLNGFLCIYLIVFAACTGFRFILEGLNASHVKRYKDSVPEPFQDVVDRDELGRMNRYTLDRTRFSVVESVWSRAVFLAILLSGLLPWLAEAVSGWGFVLEGLVFFALPGAIGMLADLPFDYYSQFVVEERHGFNTQTPRLWFMDQIKSLLVGVVLGGVLLGLLLFMIRAAGPFWWVWAWAIILGFQLLVLVLYPTVIAPLFNTFTPVEDQGLASRIRALAERHGVQVKDIMQMDAGRRSRHTNAYFSGLGRVKRIVLYDTLIQAHDEDEILAVLAHEMGHLKKGHVWKQILMFGGASLPILFIASLLIHWPPLFHAFGFSGTPAYAGLFLVGVLWEPLGLFLSPLPMALSRRFERQADRFALKAGEVGSALKGALKKMARDNLSNLRPHPLYVRFHYSHPPLLERIQTLESCEKRGLNSP